MTLPDYRIATNYNVALNSLVKIGTITASGDTNPFYYPQAVPHGSPGVRKGRLTGLGYRSGFPRVDWVFGALTRAQYEYLKTTYCSGGYSGFVTIYTTVSGNTYARYNAVIDVPETEAIQNGFVGYYPVPIHFTRLVAL